MTLYKHLFQVFLLLLITSFLIVSCSPKPSSPPQSVNTNQQPTWIDKAIDGNYVGLASYALRTTEEAREQAINSAVSRMLHAKAGNTAEVQGEMQNTETILLRGGVESLTNSSIINTTATISGNEIPVQFRVIEYWRDRENGYIYVLIEDLAL